MQFSSYKVNIKHRNKKPTEKASIWSVSEWIEIQLFGLASKNEWYSNTGNILWSIRCNPNGKPQKIGDGVDSDLYIAKFRCDNNSEWHGYPVYPKDQDTPPDSILELWRLEKIIDKTDKRRIQKGQFKK